MSGSVRGRIAVVVVVVWFSALASVSRGVCPPVPGDMNGNAAVDLADFIIFAACFTGAGVTVPPGSCSSEEFAAADLDGDGDADLTDFVTFASVFGQVFFDYGPVRDNAEAEYLAMEVSNKLRAPDREYDRILRDLALIRDAYPELSTVINDPSYVTDQLVVKVSDSAPTDGYDELNRFYRVVDIELLFCSGGGCWYVLTYCGNLNAPVLGVIYVALPEVMYADPNYIYGHDDFITVAPEAGQYRYDIDDGFWDCFDGCDCHRLWELTVSDIGEVTLISYQEVGQSWCEF